MKNPTPALTDPLLAQFALTRAEALAGLLESADLADICELFATLPARNCAQVAASLSSRQLYPLLTQLEPRMVGELLVEARQTDAVTLLAHLREAAYPGILTASPKAWRARLNTLFNFPSRSLAAMASPDFIRVRGDTVCEACLDGLKAYEDVTPRPICVVDEAGVYRGLVNLQALIASKNRTKSVVEVADKVTPLSGQMTVSTAMNLPQWLHYPSLPVVDAKKRLLGVTSRAELEKLNSTAGAEEFGVTHMLSVVATHFMFFCAQILEQLFAGKTK